jgi:hypothetical protein
MLRHKVWPVLLKYHPYVINPYISANVENDDDAAIPEGKVKQELMKYFRIRNKRDEASDHSGGSSPNIENKTSPVEEEIIRIMEAAIHKFFNKWGAITKYDSGFAWIALGLAEWFPPIPNSHYVLVGRDVLNKNDSLNKHLTQLSEYNEDSIVVEEEFSLDQLSLATSEDLNQLMTFSEVYERLILVLLHSREEDAETMQRRDSMDTTTGTRTITELISSNSLNQQELLFKSGKIDTRVSFFLVAFAKLLPELYISLSEDDMLNNNSNKNNKWLTWWLKYCGAKVLNKFDRGRIWDSLLGFRYHYSAYVDELSANPKLLKRFKKLYDFDLNFDTQGLDLSSDIFWYKPSEDSDALKWSQIDYQLQLVFIFVSVLQKNESKLLEFDQFEINEFLNKLPLNIKDSDMNLLQNSGFYYNDFDKILKDAGELWRNWLWNEIRDEINE